MMVSTMTAMTTVSGKRNCRINLSSARQLILRRVLRGWAHRGRGSRRHDPNERQDARGNDGSGRVGGTSKLRLQRSRDSERDERP